MCATMDSLIIDEDRRRRLRLLEEKIQDPRSVSNVDCLLVSYVVSFHYFYFYFFLLKILFDFWFINNFCDSSSHFYLIA